MKPHLQLKREPCEIGDDITSASLHNHLEPVPCAKCAGYQQRIAELEAELKAHEKWAALSIEMREGK